MEENEELAIKYWDYVNSGITNNPSKSFWCRIKYKVQMERIAGLMVNLREYYERNGSFNNLGGVGIGRETKKAPEKILEGASIFS